MKLPSYIASTPPPRSSGLVRADVGAMSPKAPNTGELQALSRIGGAISQAGKFAEQAYLQKRELDDIGTEGDANIKAGSLADEAMRKTRKPDEPRPGPWIDGKDTETDFDKNLRNVSERKKEYAEGIMAAASKFRNPKTKAKWIAKRTLDGNAQIDHTNNRKFNDAQVTKFRGLAENAASQGDLETANMYIDKLEELGRIYPSAAAEYKADNAKILINSEIANYKTRAANEKNPVERKEIFNDLQDYINKQPSSMLSAVDAEAMSSSATSYQLQLEKRTTDAKYGNQQEQFDSFVLDAAKGNFPSVDVIENSILDDEPPKGDRKRASKSIMKKWVDGSVIDPPPVSTPDGFDNVNTAILKLSRGTISKENASYIIMKERYGNNSISSSDFESSIEKLDNLYPKETIPHIESIISLNRESLTGTSFWFTLDKTQQNNLQKVNSGFIGWLDKQIKDGKTPTPREMFIANAEYMTTVSDWEKTKENNAEYKKGDRRTVNDRTFIFNGVDWD